jgi:signal transduction histidine kinase
VSGAEQIVGAQVRTEPARRGVVEQLDIHAEASLHRDALSREGERILLTVDDTGIGVPEKDLPYIFDRFYRVDKARSREAGGSGLGLSIVRETVLENGGTITAQRRKNVAGAFRATAAKGALREKRIVVVDDVITTGATAEACARVLKRAGAARVDILALARAVEPSALLL